MKRQINKIINFFFKQKNTSHLEKAIDWLKNHSLNGKGIIISSKQKTPYPEVTGYTIATLYQWGEKELARRLTRCLIKQQNKDGSFSAPDGTPYTFDTGQVVRGLLAADDDIKGVKESLKKTCNWMLTQMKPSGRLTTPSTAMWGDIADDRIHLYVLPPLIKTGEKLKQKKYIKAADKILKYYKKNKDLIKFNTLSHFYAYIIEALFDLGEINLTRKAMKKILKLQKKDGSIPAYKEAQWVCLPGLAQLAVILYKLAMREPADMAFDYLEKAQGKSGGFYGSLGKEADYFPKEEVSWAVKFFLDAYYWRIKSSFNQEVDIFPKTIEEKDSRLQEVLNFFGSLNGKRIIDVGCGKGRFLRVLKSKFSRVKLYGLDISEKMLSFCPKGVETINGSILDIRYPDKYFDGVFCVETLEHALRIESAVKELTRVLKPGGKIVIIDKNKAKLLDFKIERWEQWFKPKEVLKLLKKYGIRADYKILRYEKHSQPKRLFIAWKGIKI